MVGLPKQARHRRASCLAHSPGRDIKREVATANLIGAGGIYTLKMIPLDPGVNRCQRA